MSLIFSVQSITYVSQLDFPTDDAFRAFGAGFSWINGQVLWPGIPRFGWCSWQLAELEADDGDGWRRAARRNRRRMLLASSSSSSSTSSSSSSALGGDDGDDMWGDDDELSADAAQVRARRADRCRRLVSLDR